MSVILRGISVLKINFSGKSILILAIEISKDRMFFNRKLSIILLIEYDQIDYPGLNQLSI